MSSVKLGIDSNKVYLRIDCLLHWGWRLNLVPFSKSRPPLRVLPPTTLIGALAFPINRASVFPETYGEFSGAERLRQTLKYVGYRIDSPLIEYSDLSKVSFYYRGGKAKTDAVAVGKTYSLSSSYTERPYGVTLCYIIDKSKANLILKSENIERELLKAACSITRSGSRESILVPLKVSFGEAKSLDLKRGETSFSFLRHTVTLVKGNYIMSQVVNWERVEIGDYKNANFDLLIVPYNVTKCASEKVYVELANEHNLYDVGGELVVGMI
ncbi:MAG: hypothetical protein FGF53_04605 [Candidatus Brockarchaeota archaeon]|nr:hypothetical protein [Candidatus Brockarchaeota archaeon]MBO3808974.1 hypothetical protein [Candidatus Brockarchaeota archaeon]MBO3842418.1 hypothetical protein [Candidatus Brockarchaeota archaeon]